MAEISLRGISKSFGPTLAVSGHNLTIADGQTIDLGEIKVAKKNFDK